MRLFIVLSCVLVALLWWASTPGTPDVTPGSALTSLGELTGMMAGLLVCVQVLLVARVPWLESAVGQDHLVSWHRSLGGSVLLLTVTHVLLLLVGGELVDRRMPWSEFWTVMLTQPDVLTATIGTAALILAGIASARFARQRLSYEAWYWLHLTTYVAVFLTFGHQINAGAHFAGNPWSRLLWTGLYLATASAVVTWRILLPLRAVLRHRVRVEAVVEESVGVASIWLRGRHLEELNTRAGQFFLFRFLAPGHLWTAHPYSVSFVPHRDQMRITIGALGDHSSAVTGIRPGTFVIMNGPFGRFTADRAGSDKVLLVAGGAGIGPIRALAHDLSVRGHDVVVLHRARSADHLALGPELAAQDEITFLPVLGRRRDLRHDPLSAGSLLAMVPDVREREVFVCGSPGLSETVSTALRSLGLPERHIHREELSMS
ncbi:ferredoxin reductase family protein [Microlunatus panaciterrae]